MELFGAGMLLPLCVLLSERGVRFGVGMLVPLQDAAAGCCSRIFLRSSRRRSVARGEWLQRKDLCSQNTSSDLANVPRFKTEKVECLSLFFPPSTYHDCYLMAARARIARRPWTGPEYDEYEDLNAHHLWFRSAGLPASLVDVLLMHL